MDDERGLNKYFLHFYTLILNCNLNATHSGFLLECSLSFWKWAANAVELSKYTT